MKLDLTPFFLKIKRRYLAFSAVGVILLLVLSIPRTVVIRMSLFEKNNSISYAVVKNDLFTDKEILLAHGQIIPRFGSGFSVQEFVSYSKEIVQVSPKNTRSIYSVQPFGKTFVCIKKNDENFWRFYKVSYMDCLAGEFNIDDSTQYSAKQLTGLAALE